MLITVLIFVKKRNPYGEKKHWKSTKVSHGRRNVRLGLHKCVIIVTLYSP
uniref:Uncharacterized protein n=1 Tax=Anguilla anguilla TaxID=7936 RepID=A0A0E9SY38_ANGAN